MALYLALCLSRFVAEQVVYVLVYTDSPVDFVAEFMYGIRVFTWAMQGREGPRAIDLEPLAEFVIFDFTAHLENPAPPALFVIGRHGSRKEVAHGKRLSGVGVFARDGDRHA